MTVFYNIKCWLIVFSLITLIFSIVLFICQSKASESKINLFFLESKTLRAHVKDVGSRLSSDKKIKADLESQTIEHLVRVNKTIGGSEFTPEEKLSVSLAWKKMDSNWNMLDELAKKQDYQVSVLSLLTFFFAFISTILGLWTKSA